MEDNTLFFHIFTVFLNFPFFFSSPDVFMILRLGHLVSQHWNPLWYGDHHPRRIVLSPGSLTQEKQVSTAAHSNGKHLRKQHRKPSKKAIQHTIPSNTWTWQHSGCESMQHGDWICLNVCNSTHCSFSHNDENWSIFFPPSLPPFLFLCKVSFSVSSLWSLCKWPLPNENATYNGYVQK